MVQNQIELHSNEGKYPELIKNFLWKRDILVWKKRYFSVKKSEVGASEWRISMQKKFF